MPKTITATHKDTGEKVKFSWDGKGTPSRADIDKVFTDKAKRESEGAGKVKAVGQPSYMDRMMTGASQSLLGPNGGGPMESMTEPIRHPLDAIKKIYNDPKSLISPESIGGNLAMLPFGMSMRIPKLSESPQPPMGRVAPMDAPNAASMPHRIDSVLGFDPALKTDPGQPISPIQERNAPNLPSSNLQPQRSTRMTGRGLESLKMQPINDINPIPGNKIYPGAVKKWQDGPPSVENAPQLYNDNGVFEGHHRIIAAERAGAKDIPVWKPSELATSFAPKHYEQILRTMIGNGDLSHLPQFLDHAKDYAPSQLENDLRGLGLPDEQVAHHLQAVHGPDLVSRELEFAQKSQSPLVKGTPEQ